MQLDKSPALLLGRPCYHSLSQTTECAAKYWTSHRYSTEVVQSMAMTLTQWLATHSYTHLVLIGYSGGGVLAMLIARQIPTVKLIVTVAANLNVSEWSRYHGYLPLNDSLNPAEFATNKKIQQLHIAGTEDKIVPAYIIEQFASKQENSNYRLIPGQDHRCCWLSVWPEILEQLYSLPR